MKKVVLSSLFILASASAMADAAPAVNPPVTEPSHATCVKKDFDETKDICDEYKNGKIIVCRMIINANKDTMHLDKNGCTPDEKFVTLSKPVKGCWTEPPCTL